MGNTRIRRLVGGHDGGHSPRLFVERLVAFGFAWRAHRDLFPTELSVKVQVRSTFEVCLLNTLSS